MKRRPPVLSRKVQTEYTRLFISAYPALLCPPYESYYREGLVYGQTSIDAEEWYRQYHLRFSGENEPPDHLSVELEFLAITGDSAFGQKLREWVPKFTERVKSMSKIYGPCAEDLEKFVNSDRSDSEKREPTNRADASLAEVNQKI